MKSIILHPWEIGPTLAGKKAQLRRPIPKRLTQNADTDKRDSSYLYVEDIYGDLHHVKDLSPFKIGQPMFVKETFIELGYWERSHPEDDDYSLWQTSRAIHYAADKEVPCNPKDDRSFWRKRPSVHMPRELSRATIIPAGVRVERVQDITEADAIKEGAPMMHLGDLGQTWKTHKRGFQAMWDSIYHKRAPWESNPYVWLLDFELEAHGPEEK